MIIRKADRLFQRLYVVINKPVECKIPYFVSVEQQTPFLDSLYARQSNDHPHLSKRELEKLIIMPMTGPRYSLLQVDVPVDWFDPKKLE